ncbi:MAG TPA: CusA/CzcA family heavy metal efflux RND transporter [Gemmatimonadaceae bacterium]|nr:CusA/CzcA family heavy metal efflux RND transporter [Gemmatimonadaceae bacterium]
MPTTPQEPARQIAPSATNRVVRAALGQPFLIAIGALGLVGVGIWSFTRLPVDAYPDLSPTMVEIVTQWPGHAAEEVERLVTVPLETEMNGVEHLTVERSVSLYGLSDVTLSFTDGTDPYFARQRVFERLGDVDLPEGAQGGLTPLSSPSGLIYRYTIDSPDRSAMELKIINDWILSKAYKGVPGVADESGLGGETMEYHVDVDPTKLAGAGLTIGDVENALSRNNGNAGGGFYSEGGQFYYIRGLGRVETTEDIGNIVLKVEQGVPVLVKDIATVAIGHAPRLGQFGFNDRDDAVEGVILMRTGEQAQTVLKAVQAKTAQLNDSILPRDVKVHPFYDRSDLIHLTTRVVEDNLLRGIVLVVVVLIFFLYDVRSGLIVAISIPGSLLFAFIVLDLRHIPANLLSIGAIDFGILVDGAVVMVENIFRQLALRHGTEYSVREVIADAAAEVNRPIVYAIAVIVAGFLPIYVLSGPSGRLFKPMADTTIFALIGSLLITILVLPPLCAWAMRRGVVERRNRPFEWLRAWYVRGLDWSLANRTWVLGVSTALLLGGLAMIPFIGAEFMPHLDEGALWVRATMPYTISFAEASKVPPQVRQILRSFPEVTDVADEHGRPDDGTDATGFFNAEFYVGLKPYSEWKGPYHTKPELIAAIDKKLETFPGITFNYTQPAEDAVDEAETGLKSALDVKVFGDSLPTLEALGRQVKQVISSVRGITQVTVVEELGQPSLTIHPDPARLARYGLSAGDVNDLIEAAVGGAAATQVVQGERTFDLVVRLQPQYRSNPEQIGNILIATPGGSQVPLRQVATLTEASGASFIYRENNHRYIGVQYSVQGRDLASAVAEARARVAKQVHLPAGYRAVWGGEYKEYTASRAQLRLVLPLTLILIFLLLFALYDNFKFPGITVAGVLLSAPLGGIVALWATGTPFSVSSGIGFLALFGVSVQTAVVYISYANELRLGGMDITRATREAAILRLRPIMMTALVAAFGLLPAAIATGVGTDSQKPFALVIVGGMLSRLLISVFVMPVLYQASAREGDILKV